MADQDVHQAVQVLHGVLSTGYVFAQQCFGSRVMRVWPIRLHGFAVIGEVRTGALLIGFGILPASQGAGGFNHVFLAVGFQNLAVGVTLGRAIHV